VLNPNARSTAQDSGTYSVCRRLAERDLDSPDRELRAWAHGTLAELELLSSFYTGPSAGIEESVIEHCENIVALTGANSFPVASTRRQFLRYVEQWQIADLDGKGWDKLARAAVEALSGPSRSSAIVRT